MQLREGGCLEFTWSGETSLSLRCVIHADTSIRSDCELQVINFKGAKYKKFLHAADAELWVHQNAVGPYAMPKTPPVTALPGAPLGSVKSPEAYEPFSPKAPNSSASSSSGKTEEASSSLRSGQRASLEEPQAVPQHPTLSTAGSEASVTTTMSSNTLVVYTDGSCRGNGKVGSVAGVGVWWGDDDPRHVSVAVPSVRPPNVGPRRNISERCPGHQTNNRAELIVSGCVLPIVGLFGCAHAWHRRRLSVF